METELSKRLYISDKGRILTDGHKGGDSIFNEGTFS